MRNGLLRLVLDSNEYILAFGDEPAPDCEAMILRRSLKPADAQIGAYAEWVKADFLISENRDFLALAKPIPFRVMKASAFLKLKT